MYRLRGPIFLIILVIFWSSGASAYFRYEALQREHPELFKLIYEDGDFKTARNKITELLKDKGLEKYNRAIIEEIRDLIRDYSDFEWKPLRMFLLVEWNKEDSYKGLRSNSSEEQTRAIHRIEKEESSGYKKILEEYPNCRLACYVKYKLGNFFRNMEDPATADIYRDITNNCTTATFPLTDEFIGEKRGIKIVPLVHYRVAIRYLENAGTNCPSYSSTIRELRLILKKYPDEKDALGSNMAINAYVNLLWIYGGMRYGQFPEPNSNQSTEKAKKVCNILLSDYQNQRFSTFDLYGETHIEAMRYLAVIARDKNEKIEILKQAILKYPNAYEGSYGCGGIPKGYAENILDDLVNACDDIHRALRELQEIVSTCNGREALAFAFLDLAKIHAQLGHKQRALQLYSQTAKRFSDIGGEGWGIEGSANWAIENIDQIMQGKY